MKEQYFLLKTIKILYLYNIDAQPMSISSIRLVIDQDHMRPGGSYHGKREQL